MAELRAFAMPKWGIEMTEGVVAEWLVQEGAPFKKGDLLALIETDKITNEVEAEGDGMFARLVAQTGGTYQVGELIAVLAAPDDAPSAAEIDAFVAGFKPADGKVACSSQGHGTRNSARQSGHPGGYQYLARRPRPGAGEDHRHFHHSWLGA